MEKDTKSILFILIVLSLGFVIGYFAGSTVEAHRHKIHVEYRL